MKKVEDFYDNAIKSTDEEGMKRFLSTQKDMAIKILGRLMDVNVPMEWLPFISLYINTKFLINANAASEVSALIDAVDVCDRALKNVKIEWE